jgi:type IV pilus assembly protein PilC
MTPATTRGVAAVLRAFDDGRHRAEFYRTWQLGLSSGLTQPAILGLLGPFTGATRALHAHLLEGAQGGRDIATLVRARPALFEPFEAALLVMAEESGTLDVVLASLADFFERQFKMMLVVKKHLAYPLFVSFFAIWIAPLPLVVRGQVPAYFAAVALGLLGWFAFGGSVLAGRAQAYQRRPAFVRARFARTLMLTLEAGLPLPRAVRLAAGASGDPGLAKHVARFDERTLGSQSLEATLTGAPALTPDLLGSLRVAERTGDFRTTLGRLAELYEDGFR